MRVALGVIGVLACGPGLTRPEPKATLADVAGDAASLEKLLQGSVTNGGLWFDNAACASQFQTPGEIDPPQFAAFARCLAELKLQRSAREDALGDVVVMHYAPGFEVQARVVNESSGPRLTWIGFASRRSPNEHPTITPETLEALRLTGDRNGPLAADVASKLEISPTPTSRAQYTWLRVCVDETGSVSGTSAHETTSLEATKAFADAARTWTFKPFTIQGQPVPVCSMVRLAYPPGEAPPTETIPLPVPPSRSKREPIMFAEGAKAAGKRISGEVLVVPDDETKFRIQKSKIRRIDTRFRVCVDETGHVESVLPLRSSGYASYDRRMLAAMQAWVYSPFTVEDVPVPVCIAVRFIYTQR